MSRLEQSQKIAQFVIKRLEDTARQNPATEHDPVYRWEHTLRVAQYGEQIALAEGAVSKTVEVIAGFRGFESHPLR